MSQISSINFKKSVDFQVWHNTNIRPGYAIGGVLEFDKNGYEARDLKTQIINEAIKNYTNHTKQKFQAKSYEWSAVCNIKPDTTMQDLEKLAEHFETKYGFQCFQIAIHRDEGHTDENGEKQINHHAHMEFITLDRQTGRNNFRRAIITPKVLRQIQSEVAQILRMERGIDKRISGRKRIEPRKYAQMKEQEKELRKENKALQQQNQELKNENQTLKTEILTRKKVAILVGLERKAWIAENNALKEQNQELRYSQKDYMKLNSLRAEQNLTITALEAKITDIRNQANERINQLERENKALKEKMLEIIGEFQLKYDALLKEKNAIKVVSNIFESFDPDKPWLMEELQKQVEIYKKSSSVEDDFGL